MKSDQPSKFNLRGHLKALAFSLLPYLVLAAIAIRYSEASVNGGGGESMLAYAAIVSGGMYGLIAPGRVAQASLAGVSAVIFIAAAEVVIFALMLKTKGAGNIGWALFLVPGLFAFFTIVPSIVSSLFVRWCRWLFIDWRGSHAN